MQKSKSPWRRWLILALVLLSVFGLVRAYLRITDDFRIANITYEFPYHPEWEIASLSVQEEQNLNDILKQNFHYIGKGAQSYAFTSDDGIYVLKFFKFKHLKPHWLTAILPNIGPLSNYKEQVRLRKIKNFNSVFTGYKIAYDLHKEESGLVYIQLNPTHIVKKVTLIDKIGLEHSVDLGEVVFVIQKKGETTRTVLNELLKNGDVATAKHRIHQVFDLYLSEYRKGIYDRDHGIMHNIGFIGDQPFHLDMGKMSKDNAMKDPKVFQEDLIKVAAKIEIWMHANYPQYYTEVVDDMENELSHIFERVYVFNER